MEATLFKTATVFVLLIEASADHVSFDYAHPSLGLPWGEKKMF